MAEPVLVKIWHGGKLRLKPRGKYHGGVSDMFEVDPDRMSFFELADWVLEKTSYKNKSDFLMYYLVPGKKFDQGLVLLKNDVDVNKMMTEIGDDINHILHLYIQDAEHECVGEYTVHKSNQSQAQSSLAQVDTLNSPVTNPTAPLIVQNPTSAETTSSPTTLLPRVVAPAASSTPKGKFTKKTARRIPTESEDASDTGSDNEVEDELVDSDEEWEGGSGAKTDDDEWKDSVQNTQNFIKDLRQSRKEVVRKVIQDVVPATTQLPSVQTQELVNINAETPDIESEYEDSDGYVNSPGEEEEDDIRGNKYRLATPTVTDTTDWTKWQWVVGTRFESREAFKSALKKYAVFNGRNVSISTSNKNRSGRLGVTCVPGCPFRLYLSYHDRKGCFMVKSVTDNHTCQRNMAKNRQLTQQFLAETFLPVFNTKSHWPAKEIQDAVKEKFKVIINPWLAYKAKKTAHKMLHGSMREHYSKLGSYLAALRKCNPTSTFELLTVPSTNFDNEPGNEVFFRLFICFDALKRGFLAGCRKLLCLDGCFLKTFLGGMLLCAIGRDANDQMFPVAWAVVEGENTDSWTWFMEQLKKSLEVVNDGYGWTLISDQQKGLLNAVVSVWSRAEHINCARHIYANWNKKHKGEELKECFLRTVRAYCEPDFNKGIEEMRELSGDATEAFLNQNPKIFCRAFLDTQTKVDVVVNNMAETYNGYIIHSRSKHLINMLEDIRVSIMTRITKMSSTMSKKELIVCPRIQIKLDKEKDRAYRCEVFPSSKTMFQVKELDDVSVDIANRTCSCRKWDLTGIPCFHACSVIGFLGHNAEDYVADHYLKSTYMKAYEYSIPPLPSQKFWPAVDFPLDPPPIKIGPGRPKKNRKRDPHEDPKRPEKLTKHGCSMTCSVCKGKGHNKRRCPNKAKPATTTASKKTGKKAAGSSQSKKPPTTRGTKGTTAEGPSTQKSTQNPSQGVISLA